MDWNEKCEASCYFRHNMSCFAKYWYECPNEVKKKLEEKNDPDPELRAAMFQ